MEAVKKRNPNHRSFYRHVAVDVSKGEVPCTFSSKEYRETLARDILQQIKRIKVPALFKFPPNGLDGIPKFLQTSKFITATKVRSEVVFYENESGEILSGKNPEIKDRYLYLRPDVVFYNEKDEPILFIELVVTHKISDEKRVALKRLGIDTVQFIVPRKTGPEIEEALKSTKHTKWIYNELESHTSYSQLPSRDTEGLSYVDDEQRKLFAESYKCRAAQIGNLVRSIGRNLESQQYIRTRQRFESEISRIESAAKETQQRLEQMERAAKEETYSEFAGRYQDLREEEERLEIETRQFKELSASGNSEENLRSLINRIQRDLEEERRDSNRIEKRRGEIQSSIAEFGEYAAEQERKIEEEFGEIRDTTIRKIAEGTFEPTPGMLPGVKSILEAWRFLGNHHEARQDYERYRAYQNFIRNGTWKEW